MSKKLVWLLISFFILCLMQPGATVFAASSETEEWFDRMSLKADFRLRHESQFRSTATGDRPDLQRQRIRFRIAGKMHVLKDLDIGFRLATGGTDPISTNQTLGNSFETKGIQLDQAYAAYQYGPGTFKGGKFANPFYTTEVIWDGDVTFEGLAQQFKFKPSGDTQVFVTLGQFFIDELATDEQDPYLLALQAGIEQKLGASMTAKIALAYYDYDNTRGRTLDHATSGNTLGFGAEQNDYDLIDILGEISFDLGVPVKVFGQYVNNTDTASGNGQDTAINFGLIVGAKPKQFGDWQFRYYYRVVEADAVVDALSDSDFHGSGTNSKGSEFGLDVGVVKGVAVNLTYFITQAESGPKNDRQRFQGDLLFKF